MKAGFVIMAIVLVVLLVVVAVMVTRDFDRTNGMVQHFVQPVPPAPVVVSTSTAIAEPYSVQPRSVPITHQPYGIMNDGGIWRGRISLAAQRVFGPIQIYGGYGRYSLPINVTANTIYGSPVTVRIYTGGDGDIFFDSPVPANNITAIFLP